MNIIKKKEDVDEVLFNYIDFRKYDIFKTDILGVRCLSCYELLTFRIMLSDFVYNAIQNIPENILEYKIIYKNNVGESYIQISTTDDEFRLSHISNKYGIYPIDDCDILSIYTYSKVTTPDLETYNLICELLLQGGDVPFLTKIDYVVNPKARLSPKFNK